MLFLQWNGLSSPSSVLILAVALLCWLWPIIPFRVLLSLAGRSLYWRPAGAATATYRASAALLVSQPLHGLDFLWLLSASPRSFRLFLCTGLPSQSWLARSTLRGMGAFVLDSNSKPEDGDRMLEAIRAALVRGELVCLFAERVQTQNGLCLEFARLLESIEQEQTFPIIPCFRPDQPWGSQFHTLKNRVRWRRPQELPYVVEVTFGPPRHTRDAGAVCRMIHDLSADAAIARNRFRLPVHRQFVRMAARHPFRPCLVDSTLKLKLSYGRTLAGAMCLRRVLKPLLGDDPMVGIWLPPSIGGVLSNVALCFLGKVAINLNYTASAAVIQSALRQCSSKHVLTSNASSSGCRSTPVPGWR